MCKYKPNMIQFRIDAEQHGRTVYSAIWVYDKNRVSEDDRPDNEDQNSEENHGASIFPQKMVGSHSRGNPLSSLPFVFPHFSLPFPPSKKPARESG